MRWSLFVSNHPSYWLVPQCLHRYSLHRLKACKSGWAFDKGWDNASLYLQQVKLLFRKMWLFVCGCNRHIIFNEAKFARCCALSKTMHGSWYWFLTETHFYFVLYYISDIILFCSPRGRSPRRSPHGLHRDPTLLTDPHHALSHEDSPRILGTLRVCQDPTLAHALALSLLMRPGLNSKRELSYPEPPRATTSLASPLTTTRTRTHSAAHHR